MSLTDKGKTKREEYVKSVICSLLKLRTGDALTINTDEEDFSLAREIANEALSVTKVQVRIVVTQAGRPVDVIEFDPELTNIKASENVLLRIRHGEASQNEDSEEDEYARSDEKKDANADKPVNGNEAAGAIIENLDLRDMRTVQKLGHLADPIELGRRISVPFSVISSNFETFLFNTDKEVLAVDYVTEVLNHADVHSLHITDENSGTDFHVDVPEEVFFVNHHLHSAYGRDFVSSADFKRVRCTLDACSAEGVLCGYAHVLGKKEKVRLVFKNGKVSEFSGSPGLKALFACDENLRCAGFIELQDGKSRLCLGGALLECLRAEPETFEDMPSYFNTSLYTIGIDLPKNAHMEAHLCNGESLEILRSGYIVV